MKKHVTDMTQGKILQHILSFAFPIMVSGFVQVLYTTVGSMIVGHLSGDASLAAVGSSAPAINILTNIFLGFSSAANVMIAEKIGLGDETEVSRTIQTVAVVCMFSSIFLTLIGLIFCKPILHLMNTPQDIFDLSALYMRLYFLGIPSLLVYHFGSAVMRAAGDTRSATYIITVAGILNVMFHFLFVGGLRMGIWGTGISLILSQTVSAIWILCCLTRSNACYRWIPKELRIARSDLKRLLLQGLKIGVQGTAVAFSNLIIQRTINGCGSTVMAGNSAANAIEGLIYIALNAFLVASLTFTAQNLGTGNYRRIRQGLFVNLGAVTLLGITLTQGALLVGPRLLSFFSESEEVLLVGMERLRMVGGLYVLSGCMEVLAGAIHGFGASGVTTIASLLGDCGVRLIMIRRFTMSGVPRDLYLSFPLAWLATGLILMLGLSVIYNAKKKRFKENAKGVAV